MASRAALLPERLRADPRCAFGGAAAGAAAEHERLGDRIAGQPVGAVGAADRLAGDEQAGDSGFHARVDRDAAHVIMRDRRDLDRHSW